MKRHFAPLKTLLALVAIASVLQVNMKGAHAQPPGIILNPGERYVPGSLRDQFGNPVPDFYVSPGANQRPQIQRPDFTNPDVFNSGFQNEGFTLDPFTGQVTMHVGRSRIKNEALDPNRGIVDPGSLQIINRYERDEYGIQWHITGRVWTSYGRPHSELNRSRTSVSGGLTQQLNDRVETRIVDEVLSVPQVDRFGRPIQSARSQPRASSNQGGGQLMDIFK
jgi:hypothetical protein